MNGYNGPTSGDAEKWNCPFLRKMELSFAVLTHDGPCYKYFKKIIKYI
jgi:hypothetical protein